MFIFAQAVYLQGIQVKSVYENNNNNNNNHDNVYGAVIMT